MKPNTNNEEPENSYDEKTLRRFAEEIAADEAEEEERRQTWGDTDEMLLARYVSGLCTDQEKAKVVKAMQEYPAVRECVEGAISDIEDEQNANKPWKKRTTRPKDKPEASR